MEKEDLYKTSPLVLEVNNRVRLDRLTIKDALSMQELENICFSLSWTLEQCKNAFRQKEFSAFGLWDDVVLIAYISFYHVCNELEILNLAVLPERRCQGHGQQLLNLALQIANKMGMQKASLEVRENNAPAISLYEKSGFCRVGVRHHYYPDTGENALIYQRIL